MEPFAHLREGSGKPVERQTKTPHSITGYNYPAYQVECRLLISFHLKFTRFTRENRTKHFLYNMSSSEDDT